MAKYNINSTNSRTFSLTSDNVSIGELKYSNWYSFKAEILLADKSFYQLEPKGFWDYKIELKKDEKVLLDFKMAWQGIIINTKFDGNEKKFLLKLKGFLSSKYVLVDTDEKELLEVATDFKWSKLNFDCTIETTKEFDNFENKELLLLTIIHCINYQMSINASAT
jgi:hypothetical protein